METMQPEIEYRNDYAPPEYAILGNQANTYFPLTDKKGDPTRCFTRECIGEFVSMFPAQASDLHLLVGTIETVLGTNIDNMAELAQKASKKSEIILEIRKRIFEMVPIPIEGLSDLPDKSRKIILEDFERTLADEADSFIERIISTTFKQHTHTLSLKEEVRNCSNSAKLLIMVLDENLDPRIRYEARRKLALMYYFAKLKTVRTKEHYEENKDHVEGLEWFMGIVDRQLCPIKAGEVGKSDTWVINSTHDPKNNMGTIPNLTTIKPKKEAKDSAKANSKRTEIEMRKTKLDNKQNGNIWFHMSSRDKTTAGILDKNIRNGEEVGTGHTEKDDRSGLRMVFKSKEEWEIFYEALKAAIKKEVKKEAQRIATRLRSEEDPQGLELEDDIKNGVYDNCWRITRQKGKIDGSEKTVGESAASAGFEGYKFDIAIIRPDENGIRKTHTFELQIFLPHQFVDYFAKIGQTWIEYSVNRLFSPIRIKVDKTKSIEYCSMMELLFPQQIYKGINYEALREEGVKSGLASVWPNREVEIEIPPLRIRSPLQQKERGKGGSGVSNYRREHAGNDPDSKKKNR